MKSYLIQRGTFEDKINISAIEGIDSIIDFDYMGSSEFEWGAKPKSLKRIMASYREGSFPPFMVRIKDEDFWLYIKKDVRDDDVQYIMDFFNYHATSLGDWNYRTKEKVGISNYFEGKECKQIKPGCINKTEMVRNYGYCDLWWDLENDYIIIPCKDNYKKVFDIALSKLEAKGFGKD
jgi:hypothetical protein